MTPPILAHEREHGQVAVLKGELQNLAHQIMSSVAAQETQSIAQRQSEPLAPSARRDQSPGPRRRATAEPALPAPQPWPGHVDQAAEKPVENVRPQSGPSRSETSLAPAPATRPEAPIRRETDSAPSRGVEVRRPSITDEASTTGGAKSETAALKSLLNRAAAVMQKDTKADVPGTATSVLTPPREPVTQAAVQVETLESKISTAGRGDAAQAPAGAAEPNIDRMLREIFEGRSASAPAGDAAGSQPSSATGEAKAKAELAKTGPSTSADSKATGDQEPGEGDSEQKRSLADRLRVM